MKSGYAPALRPVPARPSEPRSRLRQQCRETLLASCDRMVALLCAVDPRLALASAEFLRRVVLARWLGLKTWRWRARDLADELLEERSWVEGIEDRSHWPTMTGVDREGRYEAAFCDVFQERLQTARVVVDAGAARGLYAVMASAAGGVREIHAFEPDAGRRFALRLNLLRARSSKRIVIRSEMLGAERRGAATTLDRYCREMRVAPDLVKMDIEGAEIELLEGAREACLRHRPTLLIEFHQRRLRKQGREPGRLVELLEEYGYSVLYNGHHGALEEGDRTADRQWREKPPNDNLTAILAEPAIPGRRRGRDRRRSS